MMNKEIQLKYCSVSDVAKIFGLSKTMAYKLVGSNGFPAIKMGGKYLIDIEELERWRKKKIGRMIEL